MLLPHIAPRPARMLQAALLGSALALTGCGAARPLAQPSDSSVAAMSKDEHAHHTAAAQIAAAPAASLTAPSTPTVDLELGASSAALVVAGAGEGHSEPVALEAGLAVFQLEHRAATPIAIFLLNARGEHLALLANGTTLTSRQVAGIPEAGRYTLHVMAQDAWKVRVEQPSAGSLAQAALEPHLLDGTGSAASAPLRLQAGRLDVAWIHDGAIPLSLALWSADGRQRLDVLSNATASTGTATVDVQTTGAYVLDVLADGPWSVAFSTP